MPQRYRFSPVNSRALQPLVGGYPTIYLRGPSSRNAPFLDMLNSVLDRSETFRGLMVSYGALGRDISLNLVYDPIRNVYGSTEIGLLQRLSARRSIDLNFATLSTFAAITNSETGHTHHFSPIDVRTNQEQNACHGRSRRTGWPDRRGW